MSQRLWLTSLADFTGYFGRLHASNTYLSVCVVEKLWRNDDLLEFSIITSKGLSQPEPIDLHSTFFGQMEFEVKQSNPKSRKCDEF